MGVYYIFHGYNVDRIRFVLYSNRMRKNTKDIFVVQVGKFEKKHVQ
jgi:hypothetical protein